MSAIVKGLNSSVLFEIESHEAWLGFVSGLEAEKMLRGKKTPFLYVLRSGEKTETQNEKHYYVTYLDSNLVVRHQPLIITVASEGFYYENGGTGGPFIDVSINEILPLVMHAEDGKCIPLSQ